MGRRTKGEYPDPDRWMHRVDVPLDQWEGDWSGTDPVDMTGRAIQPGDWVVKTFQSGRSSNLEVRQVREVRPVKDRPRGKYDPPYDPKPRVYLSDSTVPVEYPGRLVVIPWDPATGSVPGLDH